jgi:hypothetical protein
MQNAWPCSGPHLYRRGPLREVRRYSMSDEAPVLLRGRRLKEA